MLYGNHNLQRGDSDGNPAANQPPRWGAVANPPPPAGAAQTPQNQGGATIAIPQHVRQLQDDLRTLGFLCGGTPDGGFGRGTEWAVKEFQIYASMTHVARLNTQRFRQWQPNGGLTAPEIGALGTRPNSNPPESYYVGSLDQTANTARYTGPISGVVNQRTRDAIEHWLDQNYRCPVVVEAWLVSRQSGQRTAVFTNGVNVWQFNQITQGTVRNAQNQVVSYVRMFYRDFTTYYTYPAARVTTEYHVLGGYTNYMTFGGPVSMVPQHTWSQAEMTPERLIGPATTLATLQANLNGATTSTYRVVRATAEQECMGYFDSINAYDDALISLGPCHWTMGLYPANGYDNGELPGFLAYVLHSNRASYLTAYGNFGLYPSSAWVGNNAGPLWNQGQRKYVGWIRNHIDSTDPATAATNIPQLAEVDRATIEANYYKTWHWFFRWVMAGRTIPAVQQAMWGMVRMRLRDVLGIPVNVQSGNIHVTGTLGTVFTSEKAAAILLRWHIFRPGHVTGTSVRNSIRSAIQNNPTVAWTLPLAQWTNAHETAVTDQLLTDATAVNSTQTHLAAWPTYPGRNGRGYVVGNELGTLRTARNSFVLDAAGI